MSLSVFSEKEEIPCDERLGEVLKDNKLVWYKILEHMENNYRDIVYEWKFYSKQSGWTFVIKSKKRTILYLIPQDGFLKANFVFGEKAVAEAEKVDIPQNIIDTIREAKCYAEGCSFMLDVRTDKDLKHIESLVKIKFDN